LQESSPEELVPASSFVLGFTTNDQMDLWAEYGHRAVCLDCSKVTLVYLTGCTLYIHTIATLYKSVHYTR